MTFFPKYNKFFTAIGTVRNNFPIVGGELKKYFKIFNRFLSKSKIKYKQRRHFRVTQSGSIEI